MTNHPQFYILIGERAVERKVRAGPGNVVEDTNQEGQLEWGASPRGGYIHCFLQTIRRRKDLTFLPDYLNCIIFTTLGPVRVFCAIED